MLHYVDTCTSTYTSRTAMINSSSTKEADAITSRANEIHENWLASDHNNSTLNESCSYCSPYRPPQPTWGGVARRGTNPDLPVPSLPFRYNRDGRCPRCRGAEPFKQEEVVDGCRMNGDAYGQHFSMCPICGWLQIRMYDEAD